MATHSVPRGVFLHRELSEARNGVIVTVLSQTMLLELMLGHCISSHTHIIAKVLPRRGLNMAQQKISIIGKEHMLEKEDVGSAVLPARHKLHVLSPVCQTPRGK